MKKRIIIYIILIIIISLVFINTIRDIENINQYKENTNQNEMGNIVWVKGVDINNINFKNLKDANIDTIFLNYGAVETYSEEELNSWIETANKNGINVHIWMQVLYNEEFQNPIKNGEINQNLLNENINKSISYAQIPGIKGIVLDYIRYPEGANEVEGGVDAINIFVGNITESIKKQNSNLIVSGTLMPEASKLQSEYGQDLSTLSSTLDYIIPMMYKGNYNQNSYWIESTTKYFNENTEHAKVITSLQSYKSDENIDLIPTEELEGDIKEAYTGGSQNIAIFRYGLLNLTDLNTKPDFNIIDIMQIRIQSIF